MRKPATRQYLYSLLGLVVFLATLTHAQQQSPPTISGLKQQIELMEKVDRDPNTTPDVRRQNSEFLTKRRAELQLLLQNTIAYLKRYKSILSPHLTTQEMEKVEASLRALEQEVRSLNGETAPLSSTGDSSLSGPRAEPAITDAVTLGDETSRASIGIGAVSPCPANADDLVGNVYVLAPSGMTATLFIERLGAPLSLTQDSDVTVSAASQLIIPQAHFQIISQHGTELAE
jgi:hypothetical protein